MEELFLNLETYINDALISAGIFAPLLACALIIVEALVPILPLFVFVSINFLTFGPLIGFLVSWLFTVIGSLIVFLLIRKALHNRFEKVSGKKELFHKAHELVNKLTFINTTLILSVPFTPSSLVNLAVGLSDMTMKKYLVSLIIGKSVNVFFWGFIGTSLVESLQNPKILILIGALLLGVYIISVIVNKKLNIKK